MKKLVTIAGAAALSAALATPAFAQGKDKKPKAKTYDFTGDDISGELIKPDGDFVDVRSIGSRTSLIRIRTNFIPEILKSAEDL